MYQAVKSLFIMFVIICMLTLMSPLDGALAADSAARFERTYEASGFQIGQDATKYEMAEGNMFKIMPRLLDSLVFTRFDVPDQARSYKEWSVEATVVTSDSPASGVGLWNGGNGHIFYVFPDGSSRLQYHEGTKTVWTTDSKIKGFAFPARISLERDAGGSILARINGVIVAARLFDVDLGKANLPDVTALSFVTRSTKNRKGAPAWYESMRVAAWGETNLMERLNKQ